MATTKGERTRARILESGFELFLSHGSHAVSLRQVASAAGLSPMAIYRHFDDKAALQFALLAHAFTTFETFLRESPQRDAPLDDLRELATQFFRFAFERAPQFRFLFLSDARVLSPDRNADITPIAQPTFDLLRERVDRCCTAGLVDSTDPRATALDILSYCVGRAALTLSGNLQTTAAKHVPEAMRDFERFLKLITA